MKRLAALACIAVVAIIVAWRIQREPVATKSDERRVETRTQTTAARVQPPARSATSPRLVPDSVRDDVEDILDHLQRAGRRCFEGRAPRAHPAGEPDESLDRVGIRIAVEFAHGTAAVRSITKLGEGFVDATLEQCVLDAMRSARWESTHADGALDLEHTVYVGSMIGRDPHAPPPREIPAPRAPLGVPRPTLPPPPRT